MAFPAIWAFEVTTPPDYKGKARRPLGGTSSASCLAWRHGHQARQRPAHGLPCSCPPPRSNRRSARGSRRRRRARVECFRSRATPCTATLATSRPSSLCSCSALRCGSLICSPRHLPGTLPTTQTACAPALAGGPHQLGAVQHAHGLSGLAWRGDARPAAHRARGRSAVEWTAAWLFAHAYRVRAQWPPLGRQCLADAVCVRLPTSRYIGSSSFLRAVLDTVRVGPAC